MKSVYSGYDIEGEKGRNFRWSMAEIVRVADIQQSKLSEVVETEIRACASLISHAGFRYSDIVRHYRIQLHFLRFPHALAAAVRALR